MKFIPVSDCNETNWRIGVDELDWAAGKNSCGCSFNVLPARLLQMSYPDYLKYLRANGGELRGHTGYTYAVFKNKRDAERVCNLVNSEWEKFQVMIMKGEFMNIDIPTAVRIFLKRSVLENGIPFSMSLPKSEYKAERALRAWQEISDTAQRNGISDMSLEEINEEIAAVRSKRVM